MVTFFLSRLHNLSKRTHPYILVSATYLTFNDFISSFILAYIQNYLNRTLTSSISDRRTFWRLILPVPRHDASVLAGSTSHHAEAPDVSIIRSVSSALVHGTLSSRQTTDNCSDRYSNRPEHPLSVSHVANVGGVHAKSRGHK